jgi:mono/diheme cytochrome c family protein
MMRLKSIQHWLVLSLLVASAWVAWDNWGRFVGMTAHSDAQTLPTETVAKTQMQMRGKYLATVGGCVGCHSPRGQALMAGGRAIQTPYGAVVSSNLSSSRQHGIGAWSLADFEMALRWGRSKDGRLLLPVFPYNHTSLLSAEDVTAMFVWLQSLPPVEQAVAPHGLIWPLGTQPVIAVWRSLYFKPEAWRADTTQSEAFNRGSYLVQGLGHCATCHGQRNALGSFPAVSDLSGGVLSAQAWVAPNLRDSQQTATSRSSVQEVADLLRSGRNLHATVSGPMAEFVQQSSQFLTAEDARSIATYLKLSMIQTAATSPAKVNTNQLAANQTHAGAEVYKAHCAGCHGKQGEGQRGKYPALAGNPALMLAQPDNLIQMALYGGYGPSTEQQPRPYGMPPFVLTLSNQEISDVLTYARRSWGNQAEGITPMQVDRVRAAKY